MALYEFVLPAVVSSSIAVIVSFVFTHLVKKYDGTKKYERATQEAVKLMLMDKTKYLTHKAVKKGGITLSQRALILQMVDTAHSLGANGEMTQCANEIQQIPTINEFQ